MSFGQSGWFTALLEQELAQHQPLVDARAPGTSPRARARAHVRMVLHDSGLLYGTPEQVEHPGEMTREEQLSLAVLRTLVRLALDLADIGGLGPERRVERLTILFAAWSGHLRLAETLQTALRGTGALPRRSVARLEELLEDRAMSLGADPVYGLLLHNGAAYVDAQLFAHLALAAWLRTALALDQARRRLAVAARQKALLVEVLTALACAERPPTPSARRAILRQVDSLGLPKPVGPMLRARVKQVFRERPDLDVLVRPVRSLALRRFILQQTVLASLVEGRRSPAELAFLRALARALRISLDALREIEGEVAEFYAEHRQVLDVFRVTDNAASLGEEWVSSMQRSLDENVRALLLEARMMGELGVFLGKLAIGQSLTPDERRRMRLELIDLAKAIPALAIFAAPGGLLLLAALAKVLPFSILPSAFQGPRRPVLPAEVGPADATVRLAPPGDAPR
ncbi:MAG TPA: hypothetical protein VMT11_20995 [Myxococcaceae bacterium]|nr:hypothetical protein [Myxococcaceae bacterium]